MVGIHKPVLVKDVTELLLGHLPKDREILGLDCTLGSAGHTIALLSSCPNLKLLGLDRDQDAISRSKIVLELYGDRVGFLKSNFADINRFSKININEMSSEFGFADSLYRTLRDRFENGSGFDFILADFGLSSDQLEDVDRGFSFMYDGALDMRMDKEGDITAEQVLNDYDLGHLIRVFKMGGVGNISRALAREIQKARPICGCLHFAQICKEVFFRFNRSKGSARISQHKNPATVPFQAVRIEVNREFEAINKLLDSVPSCIAAGGRFIAISFHSIEDKLVANRMRKWEKLDYMSRGPMINQNYGLGKLLTKKAIKSDCLEIESNPRARSAMLRAFQFNGSKLS